MILPGIHHLPNWGGSNACIGFVEWDCNASHTWKTTPYFSLPTLIARIWNLCWPCLSASHDPFDFIDTTNWALDPLATKLINEVIVFICCILCHPLKAFQGVERVSICSINMKQKWICSLKVRTSILSSDATSVGVVIPISIHKLDLLHWTQTILLVSEKF